MIWMIIGIWHVHMYNMWYNNIIWLHASTKKQQLYFAISCNHALQLYNYQAHLKLKNGQRGAYWRDLFRSIASDNQVRTPLNSSLS